MLGKCVLYVCAILATAALLALVVLAVAYLPSLNPKHVRPPSGDFSRTDYVTIILTATSVILTALAIVGAVAGAIGYATLRGAAEAAARTTAAGVAEKVAIEVAQTAATRTARSLYPQLSEGGTVENGEAFTRAEGGST